MARLQFNAATLTQVKSTGNGTAGTMINAANKSVVPPVRYPNAGTAPGAATDLVEAEGVMVEVISYPGYGTGLDAATSTKYYNPKPANDPQLLT